MNSKTRLISVFSLFVMLGSVFWLNPAFGSTSHERTSFGYAAVKTTSLCYKTSLAKRAINDAISDIGNISSAVSSLSASTTGFSDGAASATTLPDMLQILQQNLSTETKVATLYQAVSDAASSSVSSLSRAMKNTSAPKVPSSPQFDARTAYKVFSGDEASGWPADDAGQARTLRSLSEDLGTFIDTTNSAYRNPYPLKVASVFAAAISLIVKDSYGLSVATAASTYVEYLSTEISYEKGINGGSLYSPIPTDGMGKYITDYWSHLQAAPKYIGFETSSILSLAQTAKSNLVSALSKLPKC